MDKIDELAQAGDELQSVMRRALQEFMVGSDAEAIRILDVDGFHANRRWDQALGRPVPTEAELAAGREGLEQLGREAQAAVDEQHMRAVRETSEGR